MTEETIEIHFIHPRTSKRLVADLSPLCTGEEALEALLTAENGEPPFLTQLGGETYQLSLHRTGEAITPSTTFAQAGVMNGDVVDIGQGAEGARTNSVALR
jgi:hypothetical protein